jgi:hypothetical protein
LQLSKCLELSGAIKVYKGKERPFPKLRFCRRPQSEYLFLNLWCQSQQAQKLVEAGRRHAYLPGKHCPSQGGVVVQLAAALLRKYEPVLDGPALGASDFDAGSFLEGLAGEHSPLSLCRIQLAEGKLK